MSTSPQAPLIIPAASVLLFRNPEAPELFMVRRSPELRFFGGFLAFPGGKVTSSDSEISVKPSGPRVGVSLTKVDRVATAARELFEEIGILLARPADGCFTGTNDELSALRRSLMAQQISFEQLLSQQNLSLHADDFEWMGSVVTPPFAPMRFDTAFYLSHLPPSQSAEIWPGELDQGFWATPAQVLECWNRGDCLVSPPTVAILQAIRDRAITEVPGCLTKLLDFSSSGELPPIYFAPEVRLIPLHTQALPPTSYTNAYLVGREKGYLIDPGCADPREQSRLFRFVDAFIREGGRLSAVVLTHHHIDHVAAAPDCARRYDVPILAHPATAKLLNGQVRVNGFVEDGGRLELGTRPNGGGSWHLEAIHTPGHASGHLAFYEPHYRLLFAGDMVSTVSSVVIAPPDGDLTVYLQSLERLASLECRLLLPGHGSVSSCPQKTIETCIAHRIQREEQLLASLASGPRSMDDLLLEVYKGVPEPMMKFARLQLLAGLEKLEREGKAVRDREQWSLSSSPADR
jgi:glyoxylase-like metal-dependent hydrolase (beta-lactamase superfamily II)/8-oxo-dGTP pyrophosphatase MutT (NUDIX family)